MLSHQYMNFFTETANRCLKNTRERFPKLDISDFLIYHSELDGRMFEPLHNNSIILPSKAIVHPSNFRILSSKDQKIPSIVRLWPLGLSFNSLIIEVNASDYVSELKTKNLSDVFLILGPSIDSQNHNSYMLEDIIVSEEESDFVYSNFNIKNQDKDLKIKNIYKAIKSIGTRCLFTEKFINDYLIAIQEESDSDVLAALINLSAFINLKGLLDVLSTFIDSEDVNVRLSCYFAITQASNVKEHKNILVKLLRQEKEPTARFSLLKNISYSFIDEPEFIKEIVVGLDLSYRENRFLKRNGLSE